VKFSLCHSSEIDDPGSRAFELRFQGAPLDIFVVHSNASFCAYVNSCPHTGANLDWQENQFLDLDKAFIHCSTHDALFEIDSGLCIAGPCVNQSLQALDLHLNNGVLVLDLPENFYNIHAKSA
jgi:nitrite reductase/ring-hydroxylating ferredoxin subunit